MRDGILWGGQVEDGRFVRVVVGIAHVQDDGGGLGGLVAFVLVVEEVELDGYAVFVVGNVLGEGQSLFRGGVSRDEME